MIRSDEASVEERIMESTLALRHRLSPLARLGVVAVVGTLLAGAPVSHARAAEDDSAALADDALLRELGEQLGATRRAAGERLWVLVHEAFTRTVQRMDEARQGMERVITFDPELEEPASIEASAVAEQESDATEPARSEPERPRRFEYVEGSNDPLAGL